jgi:hypothetical protein
MCNRTQAAVRQLRSPAAFRAMTCIQSGLAAPEGRLPVVQIQHQVRQDILFLRRLKVEDVTDTLNLALTVSGCDTA